MAKKKQVTRGRKISAVFTCLILFASITADAAPLYFEKVSVTQRDGAVLNLFASGDEFYNWMHDGDGFTVMLDKSTGNYVYADIVNDVLVPTKLIPGISNPAHYGLKPWIKVSAESVKNKVLSEYGNNPPGQGDSPTTGTINNLVVFIRFADETEFTDQTSVYSSLFNNSTAGANSMYNYYKEVSYNQLSIISSFYPYTAGTVVISYQDSHNRSYYKPYDSLTNPTGYLSSERTMREHTLLNGAVAYVASQVSTSLVIDGDNDGNVDNVCFIIYGSTTAWSTLLWPHRWSLYSYSSMINGKRVYDYNFQIQNNLKSSGPGILCHEMFHSLGAPDLYHYTSNGIAPCSKWDVMDYNSNPPEHMGAYMKWKYGKWISSIPAVNPGTYSLKPLTSATNNCYRINSPYSVTEYYVVEYRKKTSTFENSIPDNGLIVYRINTAYTGNAYGPPDEVYVYRPGGTLTSNGTPSTANFSSSAGRTVMNSTTDPSPFLSDGTQGGLSITSVGSPDSTITFSFTLPAVNPPSAPALISPVNGATGQTLTPLLDWSDISGTTSYKLQVSDNSSFTGYLINDSTLTSSQYTVGTGVLQYNMTYYWRVYALNSGGSSPASTVFSFSTLSVTPTVQSGIFNDGPCLVFKAKSNLALNKQISGIIITFRYLSTYAVTFQNPVSVYGFALSNTTTSAGYTYRSYSTTQSTGVNWSAEAENEIMRINIGGSGTAIFELSNKIKNYNWYIEFNGTSYTNITTPFYASSVQSPLPVTMNSMNLNASGNSVTLKWKTSSEVNNKGFDIERKNVNDSSWIKAGYTDGKGTISTGGNYTFTEKLNASGRYEYRLKQTDYNGNYSYFNFTGSAEIVSPKSYSLGQNYPNPFNPSTKISFEIPEKTMVTIKIHDAAGREIETLIRGTKEAGIYEIEWNARSYSSGVYFYRIKTDKFSTVRKMVLVK